MNSYINNIYFSDAREMKEIPNNSVHLIITSPPYFNIKDYSKDGYQQKSNNIKQAEQIGNIEKYDEYISELLLVWKECERVLKPNGKLAINVPLMPMLKKQMNTHYNRHIFDIDSDIKYSILHNTRLFLLDMYIWNRTKLYNIKGA
jgi:site-specific DNA-methyltransferase (cytosine-N4-specific)